MPSTIGRPPSSVRTPRSLAVDFANTVACPGCRGTDAFESVAAARRWFRARTPALAAAVLPKDLAELRRFRGEVRSLLRDAALGARPRGASVRAINRSLQLLGPSRIQWVEGSWLEDRGARTEDTVERIRARVAASVLDSLTVANGRRVRLCQGPGCVHFLFARSPRQLWCSPTGCGNRVRVQRHYRRARSG